MYNAQNLDKFLSGVKSIGAKDIVIDTMYGGLYAASEQGYAGVVPVSIEHFGEDSFVYEPTAEERKAYQKGNSVTANTTVEQKLATDAVLQMLNEAGVPVEVVSDEAVEEMLGEDAELMGENSECRKKREEQNKTIDKAVALVTGKDVKEVRKGRIAKERQRQEEAREMYDKVLSGDFSDVTLQQIDEYINEVTPNNVYGRRLSQRLPQGVERKMYQRRRGALGFDAIERDALFSRICESAVPKNGRTSKAGRREVERRKEEALKGWAIATGHWHVDLSEFTDEQTPFAYGTDSDVYSFRPNQIKSATGNNGDFSNSDDDIRFRAEEGLKAVNERFDEEFEKQINGELPKGHVYSLGNPSDVLLSANIPNLPIELAASRLSDKVMQDNHPFEIHEVEDCPEQYKKHWPFSEVQLTWAVT